MKVVARLTRKNEGLVVDTVPTTARQLVCAVAGGRELSDQKLGSPNFYLLGKTDLSGEHGCQDLLPRKRIRVDMGSVGRATYGSDARGKVSLWVASVVHLVLGLVPLAQLDEIVDQLVVDCCGPLIVELQCRLALLRSLC